MGTARGRAYHVAAYDYVALIAEPSFKLSLNKGEYIMFGLDGKEHPDDWWFGPNGQYNPPGTKFGVDGKIHPAASVFSLHGKYMPPGHNVKLDGSIRPENERQDAFGNWIKD